MLGNPYDQIANLANQQQRYYEECLNQQNRMAQQGFGLASQNAQQYAVNQAQQPQPNPVLLLLEDV